jgi:antirestriction protein ArdC
LAVHRAIEPIVVGKELTDSCLLGIEPSNNPRFQERLFVPTSNEIRKAITDKIVAALQQNLLPWRRPWSTSGRHSNAVSGRSYQGINPLLLELHALEHSFTSAWWASFDQWKKLGCAVQPRPSHVKPGEWGAKIVFFRPVRKTVRDTVTGEDHREQFLVMRNWTVFNADQVDGDAVGQFRSATRDLLTVEPDFRPAEELMAATGAEFRQGGDHAYYCRPIPEEVWPNHNGGDYIVLPLKQSFQTLGPFYETALHELAHWSEVRLGWNHRERGYALGELVAEIGSCFLSQELGVPQGETIENHAAYVKTWISEMQNDPKFVFQASTQASKVADFLMSFVRAVEPEIDEVAA